VLIKNLNAPITSVCKRKGLTLVVNVKNSPVRDIMVQWRYTLNRFSTGKNEKWQNLMLRLNFSATLNRSRIACIQMLAGEWASTRSAMINPGVGGGKNEI